jgi:hypothetical protein
MLPPSRWRTSAFAMAVTADKLARRGNAETFQRFAGSWIGFYCRKGWNTWIRVYAVFL